MRKTVIAATLLTALGGGAALAQGAPPGSPSWENTVLMVSPEGSVVQKRVTDRAMMDAMMRGATPTRPGTMVMVHGGKMYVIPDKKMSSGRMLSEEVMRTTQ